MGVGRQPAVRADPAALVAGRPVHVRAACRVRAHGGVDVRIGAERAADTAQWTVDGDAEHESIDHVDERRLVGGRASTQCLAAGRAAAVTVDARHGLI